MADHGTYAGWNQHKKHHTTVCQPCRDARNAYYRVWWDKIGRSKRQKYLGRRVRLPYDGMTNPIQRYNKGGPVAVEKWGKVPYQEQLLNEAVEQYWQVRSGRIGGNSTALQGEVSPAQVGNHGNTSALLS